MTNAELDTLWSRAEQFSGGFTRYRFAALVAAAERERIIAANAPEIERINAHIKELEQARPEEREACALKAGLILQGFRVEWPIIEEVIRAIRARNTQDDDLLENPSFG
jgi:hypothetical protein